VCTRLRLGLPSYGTLRRDERRGELHSITVLKSSTLDCRLILCSVAVATTGIFQVTNLDDFFEIVDDKFIALATPLR